MKQDEILVIYKYIIMYTDIQMVNISESANNCCLTPSNQFFQLYRGVTKLYFYDIISVLY
jgi:hypothetical protein